MLCRLKDSLLLPRKQSKLKSKKKDPRFYAESIMNPPTPLLSCMNATGQKKDPKKLLAMHHSCAKSTFPLFREKKTLTVRYERNANLKSANKSPNLLKRARIGQKEREEGGAREKRKKSKKRSLGIRGSWDLIDQPCSSVCTLLVARCGGNYCFFEFTAAAAAFPFPKKSAQLW